MCLLLSFIPTVHPSVFLSVKLLYIRFSLLYKHYVTSTLSRFLSFLSLSQIIISNRFAIFLRCFPHSYMYIFSFRSTAAKAVASRLAVGQNLARTAVHHQTGHAVPEPEEQSSYNNCRHQHSFITINNINFNHINKYNHSSVHHHT